jgi:hypothetical protein
MDIAVKILYMLNLDIPSVWVHACQLIVSKYKVMRKKSNMASREIHLLAYQKD